MKLQHYLGGLEGLGPVDFEKRVFVEDWEKRIFGIHTAMMALSPQLPLSETPSSFKTVWTWADLRKGAESLNPFDYFKYRYYEKWLGGISGYFVENGYITEEELEERAKAFYENPALPAPEKHEEKIDERVVEYLVVGDSPLRDPLAAPKFKAGEKVLVANPKTGEHTRLPGFLRNHVGIVEEVYPGAYVYLCDTGPDGIGEAMPVYMVSFDPEQLWPNTAEPGFKIYADLFEAYLEPAPQA